MKVVVAPDKFKGSLTGVQVARAIAAGVRDAGGHAVNCPVADGGDGTVAALAAAGFSRMETGWARHEDHSVVELAAVCGLAQSRRRGHRAALSATSKPLGRLITRVLDTSPRSLAIGLGGSASTDAGVGMLQGLGAIFLDQHGRPVGTGMEQLSRIVSVDLSGIPDLTTTELIVATDVDNPLLGARGAAAAFGPQKGLRTSEWHEIDPILANIADVIDAATQTQCREQPGAGAAGGVGYALQALGAQRTPGVDFVLDLVHFDDQLQGADLVITGEGSLDASTLRGKTISGVARRAVARGIPVVALCGRNKLHHDQLRQLGISKVATLVEAEPDLAQSYARADTLLRQLARTICTDKSGVNL
ncbi:MAG: glycerate kinase [Propionibacteriaceae bacterium]